MLLKVLHHASIIEVTELFKTVFCHKSKHTHTHARCNLVNLTKIMLSDDWPFCRAHEPGTCDPYTRSSQSLAWRQNTVDTTNRFFIIENTELSLKVLLRQDSQSQTDEQLMKW